MAVEVVAARLSSDTTVCSLFGLRCACRIINIKLWCRNSPAMASRERPSFANALRMYVASRANESSCPLHPQPHRRTNSPHFQAVRTASPIGAHALLPQPGCAQPSGPQPQQYLTGRVWVLRPQDVQHPTSEFYHVRRQGVLIALL